MGSSDSGIYGSSVFNDRIMRERLPKNAYKRLKRNRDEGAPLEADLADIVANSMKEWAIEKGATHFCHWFQPLTGLTAEKHDAFLSPTPDGGAIMEFSGKELCQGEPDASSFPSGGLRATFEARGYTAWDSTSPAFVKEDGNNTTLYIPSAFCSYTGEVLDKKTPLLRSMDALNNAAVRVLRQLGDQSTKRVIATLGAEQEYFLIDQSFFEKRLDLALAKRTLFGAPSPRGQEMDDHYFGTLHERVASFMEEANRELWRLGVPVQTQHNEVSPAQFEVAPLFEAVNLAADHNQLIMETLEKIALRHNFVCLLHEKPFAGVNGSGKHNNWSMATNDGVNLLDPGKTPHQNMQFLLFLSAVISAVDKNSTLVRASVANPGNDHRLGANEAPPAIVSVFLGDQLNDIFEQLSKGEAKSSRTGGILKLGVSTLTHLNRDSTDRNRTSPFAFTGNRFEFRMVGSTQSISGPAFILNTIVADELESIAKQLEQTDTRSKSETVQAILQKIATKHNRVIFNGDNYSKEWVKEAEKRGLANIPSTVAALATLNEERNIELFERQKVLNRAEVNARRDILLENYSMLITIEAKTCLDIGSRQILPAAMRYSGRLARTVSAVKEAGCDAKTQKEILSKVCRLNDDLCEGLNRLETLIKETESLSDPLETAEANRDIVIPAMARVRQAADSLETMVDKNLWPLPTYAEMLFSK